MRKIILTDEAESDYLSLPDEVMNDCDEKLDKLAQNINLGQKLSNLHGRDLSDCRKIYFNDYKHRIVYRKVNDKEIEIKGIKVSNNIRKVAEIIAIGERNNEEVYKIAAKRLGKVVNFNDKPNIIGRNNSI